MPPLAEFQAKLLKRTCPIKALLLDQSFTAGVGNWVAGRWSAVYFEVRRKLMTDLQMRFSITLAYTPSKGVTHYLKNR